MPALLEALGVNVIKVNCEPNGRFPHNPEPLPEHLTELSAAVVKENADLGIAVDPDVDRLALISEDGNTFGEEYTLVAVADYVLSSTKGATVSNLSSTRALRDITEQAGEKYYPSAVGEVNVVAEMKRVGAVIGGEGNGGVIVPDLHYGRDALIGIALFLSHLARERVTMTELKKKYPAYFMSKKRVEIPADANIDKIFEEIRAIYSGSKIDVTDGVKIDFEEEKMWVHLRRSNTEPIVRVYSEALTEQKAEDIAQKIIDEINKTI